MTRAAGKADRGRKRPMEAVEIGRASRRAGLTRERMVNYYAYDAERYPSDKLIEGWNAQDLDYRRVR